ncbi:hypothetical protein SEA_TYPHA_85 [Mycobacterium phage Typha]|uniref:Uncharacterized protein n=1 Tax=Mycobacterium phage Typha TaxID=2517971 RepID=A0A482J6P5_9CAUD|nr:hypothetical protein KCH40_gp084 [Mycobacterium phage Typha]QBP29740.1 hypothetical protein SEA_TYPHA_85 [Mycobacterium phage Typha]
MDAWNLAPVPSDRLAKLMREVTALNGRHHRPDNGEQRFGVVTMPEGTVFWNRSRWWRTSENGLHQLIVPLWHDDIWHAHYNTREDRVAAAAKCQCYICRALLADPEWVGLWSPDTPEWDGYCCGGGANPGRHEWNCRVLRQWQNTRAARPAMYHCEGPCGKAFPWFDLTTVSQSHTTNGTVWFDTVGLCRECFWQRRMHDNESLLKVFVADLGVNIETLLWVPVDDLPVTPLGVLDPSWQELGFIDRTGDRDGE